MAWVWYGCCISISRIHCVEREIVDFLHIIVRWIEIWPKEMKSNPRDSKLNCRFMETLFKINGPFHHHHQTLSASQLTAKYSQWAIVFCFFHLSRLFELRWKRNRNIFTMFCIRFFFNWLAIPMIAIDNNLQIWLPEKNVFNSFSAAIILYNFNLPSSESTFVFTFRCNFHFYVISVTWLATHFQFESRFASILLYNLVFVLKTYIQ